MDAIRAARIPCADRVALRRILLSLLLLALAGLPAQAAPASPSCEGDARQILERTLDRPLGSDIPMLEFPAAPTRRSVHGTASYDSIRITLSRNPGMSQEIWQRVRFIGTSRSREMIIRKDGRDPDFARAAVWVALENRASDSAQLNVETNSVRRGLFYEDWLLVVALCDDQTNRLLGFASVPVRVHARVAPAIAAALAILAAWLIVAATAWRQHAPRLQAGWRATLPGNTEHEARPGRFRAALTPEHQDRLRWKLLHAANPIFISQDGLGAGSLGRLQLFLFSFAVAGIVFYIWLRSGVLVGFSNDVLALLGISAGSSVLSRVADARPSLKSANHLLLLRLGIVRVERGMPSFRDLIAGNGEIDVTRVQALLFTGITLAALVTTGATDLANFKLPDQILWLMGVSQGVYVGGKLIPSEACQRLDSELDALRQAAAAVRQGEDPKARAKFRQAREGALRTLREIYGERLHEASFAALEPEDL